MARKKAVKLTPSEELVQKLLAHKVEQREQDIIEIGDVTVTVSAAYDPHAMKAALTDMTGIMQRMKNEHGYEKMLLFREDLMFMFLMAFFTDIGLHPSLETYIELKRVFDENGHEDGLTDILYKQMNEASDYFDSLYALWKDEYIAAYSYVAGMSSPVNELARRILAMLGDEGEISESDTELYNTIAELMMKNRKDGTELNKGDIRLPIIGNEVTFQKKEIPNDTPKLTVLKGKK